MNNPIKNIIKLQKANRPVGIYSACSANEYVIKAVLLKAKQTNSVALIEATANQVDQNGGYTGYNPQMFYDFVFNIASDLALDHNQVFLGGDHLGPLTWSHLNEKEAMENAEVLVREYVKAGFTKIHIDTSMKLNDDDKDTVLSNEVIAKRGAYLVNIANETYKERLLSHPNAIKPVYIVGSEVPIPGGAVGSNDDSLQVTSTSDFKATVESFKSAFANNGIEELWDDVIAIVVQPGVEEKDAGCVEYDRLKALHLKEAIKDYPTLVFEGHSTDYQTKIKLKEMVEDQIAILKVGPGLTFAYREALFALAHIEKELFHDNLAVQSNFMEVLDEVMLKNPNKWEKYYTGSKNEIRIKRKYSFSDRCRYFLPTKEVNDSINTLIKNFDSHGFIPLNLMSQFMPVQYVKVRENILENNAKSLIIDRIMNTIDEYCYATNQHELLNFSKKAD